MVKSNPLSSSKTLMANSYAPIFLILKGWLIAVFLSLLMLAALTGVMLWTEVTEKLVPYIIPFISLISIFAGSYYVGRITTVRGWLRGGLTGVIYVASLLFLAILIGELTWEINIFTKLFLGFAIGAIAGIFGINS